MREKFYEKSFMKSFSDVNFFLLDDHNLDNVMFLFFAVQSSKVCFCLQMVFFQDVQRFFLKK